MNTYETALRTAYYAFWEHPYKSEEMFNVMDKIADTVFHDTANISEETWVKLCDKFYLTFCHHARSEEEKKAVSSLMLLSIL